MAAPDDDNSDRVTVDASTLTPRSRSTRRPSGSREANGAKSSDDNPQDGAPATPKDAEAAPPPLNKDQDRSGHGSSKDMQQMGGDDYFISLDSLHALDSPHGPHAPPRRSLHTRGGGSGGGSSGGRGGGGGGEHRPTRKPRRAQDERRRSEEVVVAPRTPMKSPIPTKQVSFSVDYITTDSQRWQSSAQRILDSPSKEGEALRKVG